MPTVNYLRVLSCEHNAANGNESNREDHRNGKTKLMKAYLYINIHLQRRQIALVLISPFEVHGAIEC